MIPKISDLLVKQSRWNANQREKNQWRDTRKKAYNYYKGRTEEYTRFFFARELSAKIPIANVNVTKRVIDRISLVYMQPPIREYSVEDLNLLFHNKDHKLQRAERMCNLLDFVLLKPCWRNERLEYDIIIDFEAHFDQDPLRPFAITYPLPVKSSVTDDEPEKFAYWDSEHTFVYDRDENIYSPDDNPDMINPYGTLPFVELFKNGRPEYAYLDTDASNDLIATNEVINVAETNKNANVQFQSFGYMFATGSFLDEQVLDVGQDKILKLGADGNLDIVAPPNSVPALTETIKDAYKILAQNYHLSINFVEGSQEASGYALKIRNSELTDARKSDLEMWRNIENRIFELEKTMIDVHLNKDAGELLNVDYEESVEVLTPQEQIDKWEWELSKGLIDLADVLMQKDPDKYPTREDAQAYLDERKSAPKEEEEGSLAQALLTPVG